MCTETRLMKRGTIELMWISGWTNHFASISNQVFKQERNYGFLFDSRLSTFNIAQQTLDLMDTVMRFLGYKAFFLVQNLHSFPGENSCPYSHHSDCQNSKRASCLDQPFGQEVSRSEGCLVTRRALFSRPAAFGPYEYLKTILSTHHVK